MYEEVGYGVTDAATVLPVARGRRRPRTRITRTYREAGAVPGRHHGRRAAAHRQPVSLRAEAGRQVVPGAVLPASPIPRARAVAEDRPPPRAGSVVLLAAAGAAKPR